MQVISKLRINKPASDVFEAIIDPEEMGNYWFSSGTNRVEEGKKIIWRYDEYGAEGAIKVQEVIINERIVFVWGEEGAETKVTMTFTADDSNPSATIVEVIESGFNAEDPNVVEVMLDQKGGWVYMLTCLKGYLENNISTLRAAIVH
jgi:uncharacterized protein YndB with AHSA1/START domain